MKTNQTRKDPDIRFVTKHLKEIVRRSMGSAPVTKKNDAVVNDDGCAVYAYESSSALKALELLGKHLGMFSDKKQPDIMPDGFDIIVGGTEPGEGI